MTVTVFVWMPVASLDSAAKAVGHASLHLSAHKTYISFWPEIGSKGRAVGHNMGADRAGESGKLPDYASAPIVLDEGAMLAFWKTVKVGKRTAPYQGGPAKTTTRVDADQYKILSQNCSKIVMDCLIAGGALKNARVRTLHSEGSTITPLDIRQIAEILAGERGSLGGSKFPIADSLVDKALNAASNGVYLDYITLRLLGAAADAVTKRK